MMLNFQDVRLSDKPWIDAYLKPYQLINSEATFTYLIIWGLGGKIKVAEYQDVLYVRLQFSSELPVFMFPPIPKNPSCDYASVVHIAVEHFLHYEHQAPIFRCIAEPFSSMFRQQCTDFTLTGERDTFDYLYSTEDLVTLRGKKFHGKRNHINQFSAQYEYEYRDLSPDLFDGCLEIYRNWLKDKDIHQPGILGEMRAIEFMLPNMEALNISGGTILLNNKICAFSLGEQLSDEAALIHIEKADSRLNGLYAVINQQFAAHAWKHTKWINREEDMGLEGLRKAKLSYCPVRLVEKYRAEFTKNV